MAQSASHFIIILYADLFSFTLPLAGPSVAKKTPIHFSAVRNQRVIRAGGVF